MELDEANRKLATMGSGRGTVSGTNCANCVHVRGTKRRTADSDELNAQGGVVIDEDDLARAKKADLITLPGSGRSRRMMYCNHEDVRQYVNGRMCCIYWDAPGTYRQWEEKSAPRSRRR